MKLLRMTASFGKLDGDTLELHDGLNVLSYPNEAGKTTWAAFLEAMFYGVDTSSKRKTGFLPVKEKYLPWSGRPMEGMMELEWKGRRITIQRTAAGRVPMGKFRAWDTDTGEELDFLTGETCGETLLGVSRAVFVRSALIGQKALTVTRDASLEQRLQRLVTTGDETVSYLDTESRLRDWKNHVYSNRANGRLVKAEAELTEVEARTAQIHETLRQDLDRNHRVSVLTQEKERLEYVANCLRTTEVIRRYDQLAAVREKAATAATAAEEKRRAADALPDGAELDRLEDTRRELRTAGEILEHTPRPTAPITPEPPAGCDGMTPEQTRQRAERDMAEIRDLRSPGKPNYLWIPALAMILGGGAVAALAAPLPGVIAAGAGMILGVLWMILRGAEAKKTRARQDRAAELLAAYGVGTPEEILTLSARYAEAWERFTADKAEYDRQTRAMEEESARLDAAEREYLQSVRAFASNIYTLEDGDRAVAEAKALRRAAEDAEREALAAEDTLRHLADALGDLPERPTTAPEDFSGQYDLPSVERSLARTEDELQGIRQELAESRGSISSLGDPASLEATREELKQKIARLENRGAALDLALKTLAEANEALRSRFSPQITAAAGDYLRRLTKGRYETVHMTRDLDLSVHAGGDVAFRELAFLSGGTADQAYLALRLAICDQVLEEDTPLILDDALVFFDDQRLTAAMDVLREEAERRQILLFTCQSRETKS